MLRREDEYLLKGAGRCTADWDLPGQLHAFAARGLECVWC